MTGPEAEAWVILKYGSRRAAFQRILDGVLYGDQEIPEEKALINIVWNRVCDRNVGIDPDAPPLAKGICRLGLDEDG